MIKVYHAPGTRSACSDLPCGIDDRVAELRQEAAVVVKEEKYWQE
jgi:hypothetical protein